MKTQEDRVLEYIKEHGEISSRDAYLDLGITQLGTRIFNLKARGYSFTKSFYHSKNADGRRTTFCKYHLLED